MVTSKTVNPSQASAAPAAQPSAPPAPAKGELSISVGTITPKETETARRARAMEAAGIDPAAVKGVDESPADIVFRFHRKKDGSAQAPITVLKRAG